MFGFKKKSESKFEFDKKVLRKNDISLLTLDERWNSLFINKEKSADIISCENRIKELLKLQAKLTGESRENGVVKKKCMDRILALTTEVYEKGSEEAKSEMQLCEKEIKRINERVFEIEAELERIPENLKEVNVELLEHTVNMIYIDFRRNQKRREELDSIIEESKARLKASIDERELLAQDNTDVYSYFHDLLGGEELEKLDRIYFKD